MVQKSAYTHATAPDSMAVNTPERMPPRMMTMVIRPQTASSAIHSAFLRGTTSLAGKLRLRAVHRIRPIRHAPNSSPGNMPAMNSAAIDTVPPVAMEYMTELCDGGTRIACTEPRMVTLVANTLE